MAIAADHHRRSAEAGDFRGQFNHARMLVAQGDLVRARHWLSQMRLGATPAFLAQADRRLAGQQDEA